MPAAEKNSAEARSCSGEQRQSGCGESSSARFADPSTWQNTAGNRTPTTVCNRRNDPLIGPSVPEAGSRESSGRLQKDSLSIPGLVGSVKLNLPNDSKQESPTSLPRPGLLRSALPPARHPDPTDGIRNSAWPLGVGNEENQVAPNSLRIRFAGGSCRTERKSYSPSGAGFQSGWNQSVPIATTPDGGRPDRLNGFSRCFQRKSADSRDNRQNLATICGFHSLQWEIAP